VTAAPATGTLAPGGLTARELLDCVRGIAPHAVGGDVVEVADDAAGPTAALGAACVRAFVHAHAAGRA
jgi:arginase family enzyme